MDNNLDISLYLKIEPHVTNGMSIFQMDKFVIEDQITPYRKLKQAVMESRARLENITSMGYDLQELQIKREQAIAKKAKEEDVFEKRLLDVQIDRLQFEINRKQSILDQQHKEVIFFNTTLQELVVQMFGDEETMVKKLQDPSFHQQCETEFWTEKLSRSVFSDLVNYNTISKGVLEAVINLPIEQQRTIILTATQSAEETRLRLTNGKDTALVGMD